MGVWLVCAALLTVAVILGRPLAGGLSDSILAVALAFAGGAGWATRRGAVSPVLAGAFAAEC